jgi:HTH-type transcriptional regulator/antitoxin HigA
MITNERQYKISMSQADRFAHALKEFDEPALVAQGMDALIVQAQRDGLTSQLEELRAEIKRYERLKSGKVKQLSATDVSDIGTKLIEARIAQGLSQRQLAERLGMKEQQIQRYEQERYEAASLARIAEVAGALDVDVRFDLRLGQDVRDKPRAFEER